MGGSSGSKCAHERWRRRATACGMVEWGSRGVGVVEWGCMGVMMHGRIENGCGGVRWFFLPREMPNV